MKFLELLQMIRDRQPPALFQGTGTRPKSGPDVNIGQALELYSAHTKSLARGWERQAQLERLLFAIS